MGEDVLSDVQRVAIAALVAGKSKGDAAAEAGVVLWRTCRMSG